MAARNCCCELYLELRKSFCTPAPPTKHSSVRLQRVCILTRTHRRQWQPRKKTLYYHFETLRKTILAFKSFLPPLFRRKKKKKKKKKVDRGKRQFLAVFHEVSANAKLRFVVVKNVGENVKAFKKQKTKASSVRILSCLNWTDADIHCELIVVSARQ